VVFLLRTTFHKHFKSYHAEEDKMKILASLTFIAFILTGCTTLRPVESSQSTVQQRISSGDLVKPGDRVKIITTDENQYEIKVVSVADGYIKGEDVEVPIKNISLVEKRKLSIGKTSLLGGGLFLLFVMSQF
jgi:hypothetical protein